MMASFLEKSIGFGQKRLVNVWPTKLIRSNLSEPIASITFDDFPHSAWSVGGGILQQFDVRATFFVSAAFSPEKHQQQPVAGRAPGVRYYELDDLVSAHAHGHEIGCHTFSHIKAPLLSDREVEYSILRNAEFVRNNLNGLEMTSFAFPSGAVDIRTKRLFSKHFSVCRGTWPGINSGLIDLALLKAIALDSNFDPEKTLPHLIGEARARNAWMVFFGHDLGVSHSEWGCLPSVLDTLLDTLKKEGIQIMTLRDAVNKILGTR